MAEVAPSLNGSACTRGPRGVPLRLLALVEEGSRAGLPTQEARPVVTAEEASKLRVAVPGIPPRHALQVTVEHRHPADDARWSGRSVDGAGEHVHQRGAHEVLSEAMALTARPPILVTG